MGITGLEPQPPTDPRNSPGLYRNCLPFAFRMYLLVLPDRTDAVPHVTYAEWSAISTQTSALLLSCYISYAFSMCPSYGDNPPVFAYFMAMLWIRIHLLFGLVMDYKVIVSSVTRFPLRLQVGLPAPYRVVQSAGKINRKEP